MITDVSIATRQNEKWKWTSTCLTNDIKEYMYGIIRERNNVNSIENYWRIITNDYNQWLT